MPRTLSAALIAVFFVAAGPVFAHELDDSASVTSPGGQKIVSALVAGQTPLTEPTDKKLVLEEGDITEMRSGTGWGKLFQQLKADGRYPDYKNLGQLISSRNRLERASHARSNNLQRTSRGATRPHRPTIRTRVERADRLTRVEKIDRPTRPDRPNRPSHR